jgi:hypothetical protein
MFAPKDVCIWSTQRKPPTCHKSLTNVITKYYIEYTSNIEMHYECYLVDTKNIVNEHGEVAFGTVGKVKRVKQYTHL